MSSERDIIERDEIAHGLRCIVVGREGLGHRCGYVELPESHPWRKATSEYDSDTIPDEAHEAAHGGITWLGELKRAELPGFWVGFDAAHLGDATDPVLKPRFSRCDNDGAIRTADYMLKCCRALAQIAATETAAVSDE